MGRKNPRRSAILAGINVDTAEQPSARVILARKINGLVDERNLSQAEAAEIVGMPQPKISAIRNYKLQGISLERLMQALTALGHEVEIVVSPSNRRAARIRVAA